MNHSWYRVDAIAARRGNGRLDEIHVYVYAADPFEAQNILGNVKGIKKPTSMRVFGRRSNRSLPITMDIRLVRADQIPLLEKEIEEYITLEKAKERGFTSETHYETI